MYRLLFRPHPKIHDECGTDTPIEQCWLEPRPGTRDDIRIGVLPKDHKGPELVTLIYSVGKTYASVTIQVHLSADGQVAYRSLL